MPESADSDSKKKPSLPQIVPENSKVVPFEFTGSALTFFPLWLVNPILNVLTLGIYLPWARVRSRRYFCAHTSVNGAAFKYSANPMELMKDHYWRTALIPVLSLLAWFTLPAGSLTHAGDDTYHPLPDPPDGDARRRRCTADSCPPLGQ